MRFLDQYFEPSLEINPKLTDANIAAEEKRRLQDLYAVISAAGEIPRRLSEASRKELALDKKRCKRVAHVFERSLSLWGVEASKKKTADQRSRGAQLIWDQWKTEHTDLLNARIKYVATWGKKTSNTRAAKSMVVKLCNELNWLEYALRD